MRESYARKRAKHETRVRELSMRERATLGSMRESYKHEKELSMRKRAISTRERAKHERERAKRETET